MATSSFSESACRQSIGSAIDLAGLTTKGLKVRASIEQEIAPQQTITLSDIRKTGDLLLDYWSSMQRAVYSCRPCV